MYMRDDRRSDGPKRAGPFGLLPVFPPFGVALSLFAMSKPRHSRLAWLKNRQQRHDELIVKTP